MRTGTAIYHAPKGDSKEAEMAGVLFTDGESVDLNSNDHGHLINKLPGNKHFEVEIGEDDGKNGRASNTRNFKAGIEEGRDHDFEADRREGVNKAPIADLRQMAEAKGIDHEGMSKADLRQALS